MDDRGDRAAGQRAVQVEGKTDPVANLHALHLGRDWALMNLQCPIGLRLRRADAVGDRIFVEGNAAAALGAVYGGATVCAWYPITPSSSLADAFTSHCRRLRVDPETKQDQGRHRAGRGRARLDRHGDRRRLERRARLHRDLRARHLADAGVPRARLFRRNSGRGVRRAARRALRPACRRARSNATSSPAPMPRTATPSTCCCSPRIRPRRSSSAPQAFDLADRLQTPVFVMLDLDIGMNHRLCRPLNWDDSRKYDRGKVMTAAELDAGKDFGRYLDVDGDGIPYRTYPGTHPSKGSFFTRGTSRDRYARYTEEGARLCRQHAAAHPQVRDRQGPGAAAAAGQCRQADEIRRDLLRLDLAGDGRGDRYARGRGHVARSCCACAPFRSTPASTSFIADHDFVFVVEQNRDAQLRSLIVNECGIDPASGWCRSCTTTARRSPRASSRTRSASISTRSR